MKFCLIFFQLYSLLFYSSFFLPLMCCAVYFCVHKSMADILCGELMSPYACAHPNSQWFSWNLPSSWLGWILVLMHWLTIHNRGSCSKGHCWNSICFKCFFMFMTKFQYLPTLTIWLCCCSISQVSSLGIHRVNGLPFDQQISQLAVSLGIKQLAWFGCQTMPPLVSLNNCTVLHDFEW
jgi:hypothetical protein